MIIVCVKLHNMCIQRWKKKNPGRTPDEDDEDVMMLLENKYVGAPRRSLQNFRRLQYVESIHAKGFRFLRDDDFLVKN